jgi:hypothetical protein
MAIGRISGQLLKDDLQRDGKDLAFDTNLLYLDVVNRRVGINKTNPQYSLDITGTARSTNLLVNTAADIANIHFATNTITSTTDTLNLVPNASNAVVVQAKLQVDNLELTGSSINALGTDKDINLRPTGTGKVNVYSDMLINGNLTVTGTITADAGSNGTIALGDTNTDNVVFNADVNSNIRPNANETYSLGESGQRWLNTYTKNLYTTTLTADTVILNNGINLSLFQGKTWYVATNGGDTKSGQHQNDPYASLVKALSVAQSGDTIFIYPGTYTEIFPMTVPVGVTVRGSGIRSVLIQPTTGTRSNDAFLLNGETTVEDLTVGYFEYNAGANTGHAFRFASNFRVTTRSPYVRNISVITQGSTVRLGTNPADDPRGFLAGDAGRGGYFDGSIANSASKDVSMLFHAVTFITPGVNCITSTNGVKIEWLNSFIYFALRGFNLTTGSTGQFSTARTAVKIPAAIRVGTWAVSNTLTYYDTDKTTVLATGVIAAISGDWVYLTGRCLGFETITDRATKTITVHGDAKLSTAVKKYGTASLALDGVGDYLTVPTQTDFEFGADAWCLEAWIYNTSQPAANQVIIDLRTANPQVVPTFYINATTNTLRMAVNGLAVIDSGSAFPLNTWTHVALACDGTSTKMFISGSQVGSTYTDNNTYIQGAVTIGARFDGTTPFFGYIDDVRISKGVARYTSTFTAPAQALTGDTSTVLLLHLNGTNNSTVIVDDGLTLQDLRTSVGGTANLITYADYTKFGAEVRSIGSANVYGGYGFVGDGPGVIAYLVSQNFAYIGAGRFSTNDPTEQIPANQVVKTNGAKIFYSSIDNQGNFDVGDYFSVNQKTGEVTFNGSTFNIPAAADLVFTDGLAVTTINASKVETGNINISGNTITTLNGGLTLSSASGVITINSTKSFVIPTGTTAQRPDPATSGAIRFNTDSGYNWFEGYNGSNWIPLGQVTDLAKTTYIKAEATPGAGDKTLYFYANDSLAATLTDTTFTTDRINVGNFDITNNTITAVTPATDIQIQPDSVNFTATITPGTNVTFTGSITGTTLTITSAPSGLGVGIGYTISGTTTLPNTYITANLTGTGTSSSSTWTINQSQTQSSSTITATPVVMNVTSVASGTIGNGFTLSGSGLEPDTKITALRTGTGLTGTYLISPIQNQTSRPLLGYNNSGLIISNIKISSNTISNTTDDAVTVIKTNGNGYVRIAGTNGVVIPSGTNTTRPAYPSVGMIRFNTELGSTELWDGLAWGGLAGASSGITAAQAEDIGIVAALLFG